MLRWRAHVPLVLVLRPMGHFSSGVYREDTRYKETRLGKSLKVPTDYTVLICYTPYIGLLDCVLTLFKESKYTIPFCIWN